ncbi:MAG: glycosyltransferase [Acidobacteriota bacterium]
MNTPTTNYHPLIPNKRVALVTDWITKDGGGEKVVAQFHALYPEAPIYTSYCNPAWNTRLNNKVVTGYLQHWPFSALRRFLPVLRQRWFARLDLSQFDVIISITGNGEAKFVRKNSQQLHLSYCHTPVHFYWAQYDEYVKHPSMRPKWLARLGLQLLVTPLRKKDFAAAQKVDFFMANSSAIRDDIKTYYQRDSEVVFPPVDTSHFIQLCPAEKKRTIPQNPRCLWWSRVVPAKKVDVLVEACNQLGWPLAIVGDGPDLPRLKILAKSNISFLGYISDEERDQLIQQADLFLYASKEDFGITPVEALAAGLPVVAYGAGGALDYVQPGKNGELFASQTAASLVDVLSTLPGTSYDTAYIAASAERFSVAKFRQRVGDFVQRNTGGQI